VHSRLALKICAHNNVKDNKLASGKGLILFLSFISLKCQLNNDKYNIKIEIKSFRVFMNFFTLSLNEHTLFNNKSLKNVFKILLSMLKLCHFSANVATEKCMVPITFKCKKNKSSQLRYVDVITFADRLIAVNMLNINIDIESKQLRVRLLNIQFSVFFNQKIKNKKSCVDKVHSKQWICTLINL